MKIEACGRNNFSIFINHCYVKKDIYNDKDNLIKYIKEFIFKLKNKLHLRGFYKVRVFSKENIGIFMDINKLDDLNFISNLDLRIVISDEDIYYEVDDYNVISECNDKRFMNNMFYCIVDDKIKDINYFCEFGRFIYGQEVINLLNNSISL